MLSTLLTFSLVILVETNETHIIIVRILTDEEASIITFSRYTSTWKSQKNLTLISISIFLTMKPTCSLFLGIEAHF